MKNKKGLGVLSITLFLSSLGYLFYVIAQPCSVSNISVLLDSKSSKVNIGRQLMDNYLKEYKNRNTCPKSWLTTYKIKEVEADGLDAFSENEFSVTINYSVKPVFTNSSYWLKESAKKVNEGWIDNKVVFLIIKQEDGSYKLQKVEPSL